MHRCIALALPVGLNGTRRRSVHGAVSQASSSAMDDAKQVHLEVQEGASDNGETAWKDAGPVRLLDSLQAPPRAAAASNTSNTATCSNPTLLPKPAKEWLLSKHSIRTKKDRQNLYLFRNAPDGGINTNLLLLLHGSGDSHRPFDKLAQTMSLPRTATLSIYSRVCGIDLPFGLGSSWFQEMDYTTGNLLSRNHVTRNETLERTVEFLIELIQRLTTSWVPERIFMLGYGAGATVAIETCRLWTGPPLGGAICVGMDGLGGNATVSSSGNSGTPILLLSHDKKLLDECTSEYEAQRGKDLIRIYVQANKGMISGPKEMDAVMEFLSERLVLAVQLPQAKVAS